MELMDVNTLCRALLYYTIQLVTVIFEGYNVAEGEELSIVEQASSDAT